MIDESSGTSPMTEVRVDDDSRAGTRSLTIEEFGVSAR